LLHLAQRKLASTKACRRAEGRPSRRIGQELPKASTESFGIVRSAQDPCVTKHFRNGATVDSKDRPAAGHGLEHTQSKCLDLARMHQQDRRAICARQQLRWHQTQKPNIETEYGRTRLEFVREWASSANDQ
jgi:hypothetical protein